MNININKNIINLNINVNLNSDQINVYQYPENIDYNTDRNRKDSFGFYKNIAQNNGISNPISPIVNVPEDESMPISERKKGNEDN